MWLYFRKGKNYKEENKCHYKSTTPRLFKPLDVFLFIVMILCVCIQTFSCVHTYMCVLTPRNYRQSKWERGN